MFSHSLQYLRVKQMFQYSNKHCIQLFRNMPSPLLNQHLFSVKAQVFKGRFTSTQIHEFSWPGLALQGALCPPLTFRHDLLERGGIGKQGSLGDAKWIYHGLPTQKRGDYQKRFLGSMVHFVFWMIAWLSSEPRNNGKC